MTILQCAKDSGYRCHRTDWLEEHGIAIAGPLADRFDVTWLVGFTQG